MQYSKAIAAIVGALVSVLVVFNIDVSTEVQGAVITLATAIAVFLAPRNQPPVV
jgi:uncharacterized membrane protein YgaE (UPF0421/DUF939 family)